MSRGLWRQVREHRLRAETAAAVVVSGFVALLATMLFFAEYL